MATTENAPVVERRQSTSSLYQQQQPEIAVLYITERILGKGLLPLLGLGSDIAARCTYEGRTGMTTWVTSTCSRDRFI